MACETSMPKKRSVRPASAGLNARTVVQNPLARPAEVVVRHFVTARGNKPCTQFETKQTIPAGQTVTVEAEDEQETED